MRQLDEEARDPVLEAMLKDEELRLSSKGPPCGCGHYSHGWSGFCTHMCCDTEDCECGGYGTFEVGA